MITVVMRTSLFVVAVVVLAAGNALQEGHALSSPFSRDNVRDAEWQQANPSALAATDVDRVPWPQQAGPLRVFKQNGTYNSTGRPYHAYVAIASNASSFHFGLPPNGCVQHTIVQDSAKLLGCEWATNGGFFAFTPPACIGEIVIDEKTVSLDNVTRVNFGMKRGSSVTGVMVPSDIKSFGFTQLLSGSGWLVRKGVSYIRHSPDINPSSGFATEKAPRTAIGVMANGAVISVVVDGVEATKEGPDLFELAELMVHLGAYEAINLDGGGSTTAVYKDEVYNRPTCHDVPTPLCQRQVTTVTCIKP